MKKDSAWYPWRKFVTDTKYIHLEGQKRKKKKKGNEHCIYKGYVVDKERIHVLLCKFIRHVWHKPNEEKKKKWSKVMDT